MRIYSRLISVLPDIIICDPAEFKKTDDASLSNGVDDSKDVFAEFNKIRVEVGADVLISEGEKTPNEGIQVEEGRKKHRYIHTRCVVPWPSQQ